MEILPIHTKLFDFIEYEANGPFTNRDAYIACKIYNLCENPRCETLQKNPAYTNRQLCPNKSKCIDNDEANIRMQLRKLADPTNPRQMLEKSKRVTGCYRKIDKTHKKLDIANAEPGVTVDFRFPMGLDKVIRVVPKTLIAVAGDSGVGKSAYCLNVVLENLNNHVVHYFANNQMTASRIKERLLEYNKIGAMNMDNFDAEEREDNYADVIYPDGINVIDYITVPSDRPSSIESELNAIVSKFTTGVCFAALQKKRSGQDKKGNDIENDLAVGGEWTFRVPSVYLAMHKGNKLKICKTKERVHRKIDPEGMVFKFKLHDGINFECTEYPPEYASLQPQQVSIDLF